MPSGWVGLQFLCQKSGTFSNVMSLLLIFLSKKKIFCEVRLEHFLNNGVGCVLMTFTARVGSPVDRNIHEIIKFKIVTCSSKRKFT